MNWVRKINQNGSASTHTHSYDGVYRLNGTSNGSSYGYSYDDGNNRTQSNESGSTQTFSTDDRNRLTTSTGFSYEYDDNGNLTEVHNTSTGAKTYYTWDDINRLKTIQEDADGDGAAENGDKRSSMYYDGLGRRYRSYEYTHNGSYNVLQRVDNLVWGGREILQRRSGTGQTTVKNNYYGMSESRHTSSTNKTDYYYTLDHLGSIREVLNSSGTIQAAYDYTPYGKRTKIAGSLDVDFGFTGHWHHADSGLILAMYRAYDPALGRWLSEDPEGEWEVQLELPIGQYFSSPFFSEGLWPLIGGFLIAAGLLVAFRVEGKWLIVAFLADYGSIPGFIHAFVYLSFVGLRCVWRRGQEYKNRRKHL